MRSESGLKRIVAWGAAAVVVGIILVALWRYQYNFFGYDPKLDYLDGYFFRDGKGNIGFESDGWEYFRAHKRAARGGRWTPSICLGAARYPVSPELAREAASMILDMPGRTWSLSETGESTLDTGPDAGAPTRVRLSELQLGKPIGTLRRRPIERAHVERLPSHP